MKKRITSLILIIIIGACYFINPLAAFFSDEKLGVVSLRTGSVDVSISRLSLGEVGIVDGDLNEDEGLVAESLVRLNSSAVLTFFVVNRGLNAVDFNLELLLGFEDEIDEAGRILVYDFDFLDEDILLDIEQNNAQSAIVGLDAYDKNLLLLSFGQVLGIHESIFSGSLNIEAEQEFKYKLFFFGGDSNPLEYHGRSFETKVLLNADVTGKVSLWNVTRAQSVSAATIIDTVFPVIELKQDLPKTFFVTQFEDIDLSAYAEAIDPLEGDISLSLSFDVPEGLINRKAGSYLVTYYAQNSLGIEAYPTSLNIVLWDFARLESGNYHTLALTTHGQVYAWGNNYYGQLGDGTNTTRTKPIRVTALSEIVDIAAAKDCSFALDKYGYAYSWGLNSYGQLGDGTTDNKNLPQRIVQEDGVHFVQIAAGFSSAVAVTDTGHVYAWGYGLYGTLADGEKNDSLLPKKTDLTNIKSASIHRYGGAAISFDGDLYTWGDSTYGRLGNGSFTSFISKPNIVEYFYTRSIKIKSVKVALYATAVISTDGQLYTWGYGGYGQLGNGLTSNQALPVAVSLPDKVVSADVGDTHTGAVTQDGKAYFFGDNSFGQLGLDGIDVQTTPLALEGVDNIGLVSLASLTSLVLVDNRTVFAFGYGGGLLGNGTSLSSKSPVEWIFNPPVPH